MKWEPAFPNSTGIAERAVACAVACKPGLPPAGGAATVCLQQRRASGPAVASAVIVVGNVVAGGTGKTPLVLWLAAALRKRGWKPGILSRGYRGSAGGTHGGCRRQSGGAGGRRTAIAGAPWRLPRFGSGANAPRPPLACWLPILNATC